MYVDECYEIESKDCVSALSTILTVNLNQGFSSSLRRKHEKLVHFGTCIDSLTFIDTITLNKNIYRATYNITKGIGNAEINLTSSVFPHYQDLIVRYPHKVGKPCPTFQFVTLLLRESKL